MVVAQFPPYRPTVPTHSTNEYYQVIQEADRSGANGYYGSAPDGAVSQQELSTYVSQLGQQRMFMQMFGSFFEQFFGANPFAQAIEQLDQKLEVANIMQNEFTSFDRQGDVQPNDAPRGDGNITYREVYDLAGRDGNHGDVTDQDINGPVVPPEPPVDPTVQRDLDAIDALSDDFATHDLDGNGFLDRGELAAAGRNGVNRDSIVDMYRNHDSLIFGNIDPGNDAWFGMSQADLDNLRGRVAEGQSIHEAAADIRTEQGREDAVDNRRHVQANQERIAYSALNSNFDQYDTNGNGVLEASEIRDARNGDLSSYGAALLRIQRNEHSLMFASIDPGNSAWHGLTQNDLRELRNRAASGETVRQTEKDLRSTISEQRGYPESYLAFYSHIMSIRDRIPNS